MVQMDSYKGGKLGLEHRELQTCFENAGGSFYVTGNANKTIRLIKGGRNYGYINNTVLKQDRGVMGYRSPDSDKLGFKDACLAKYYNRAEALFSKRYSTDGGWVRNPQRKPRLLKGQEVYYLIITDLKLAKIACDCFDNHPQKETKMSWSHQSVYDALVNDPRFSNTNQRYVNPYVCISSPQQAGKGHSMILYSPSCKADEAKNRPYHYDDKRKSFDWGLHMKIKPFIDVKRHETNQGKNWFLCEVLDWNQFAQVLGLVTK